MRYTDELFNKGLTIKSIEKLRKVKRYGSKTEAAKVDPKTKDSAESAYADPILDGSAVFYRVRELE